MSTVKLIDSTGREQGAFDLEIDFPRRDVLSPKNYACAIRVLQQNWRQGTVGCKARSDVSFSNRKPWKQKGTGRARAGSARSPLWRKGGVTFGPQARVRTLKLNRKQRRCALRDVFQLMLDGGSIYCLDYDFSQQDAPKTKEAYALLKSMGVEKKKGLLFLPYEDTMNFAAFRNIPFVGPISFDQPNVFDLSDAGYWMFLKRDVELFKNMVAKWI